MTIATTIIAAVLAFVAWKVLSGIVKTLAMLALVGVGFYLFSQGLI